MKSEKIIRIFHEEVSNCACGNKIGVKRLVCQKNDTDELLCVWEEIVCENCKKKYRIEHFIEPSNEKTRMNDAILILKDFEIDKSDEKLIALAHHLTFHKQIEKG